MRLFRLLPNTSTPLNECLCWIPYNRASGYNKWTDFGINYAYMQPNHFWEDKNEHPLPRFFSDIKANNLAMEFDPDLEALLENPTATCTKTLREYISNAKSGGIYGKQPLSYYHGTNGSTTCGRLRRRRTRNSTTNSVSS